MTSWRDRLRRPEQARTTRAPVLSPAPAGWLGLPMVRGLRVLARDGALLLQRPDGTVEQLAAAGEVTRVGVLSDDDLAARPPRGRDRNLSYDAEVLVVLAGSRPVLALSPAEWVPGPVTDLAGRDARRLSGADALAGALGVPIEPLSGGDVGQRPELLPTRPEPTARRRWLTRLAVAALAVYAAVLAVLMALAGARDDESPGEFPLVLAAALASVACGGLALDAALRRRQAASLVAASPLAATATWRPVPGVPVARSFRRRAALLVGAEEVVVRDAEGREAWLPGPARGGVDRALVTDELLVLADADGHEHVALPLDAWAGTPTARDDVTQALTAAGLRSASGLAGARPPVFARGRTAGPLDHEWLFDLREHTGLPTTNQVFAVTGVAAVVLPVCLAAGAVGVVAAVPAAFAVLYGVVGGAVRWVTSRRERALEAP